MRVNARVAQHRAESREGTATGLDGRVHSAHPGVLMAGPQVTVPTNSRFKPFGQALVGLAHQRAVSSLDLTTPQTGNGLAMAFGGGVDVLVHSNLAVRAAQVQYLQSRAFSETENTWTLSTGVVFRFR